MSRSAAGRLLVVDDDETILRLFSAALGREGYEVATAATGRDGLRLAAETSADVVLLDVNLPDLSGVEVMHQIVKTTMAAVILITGDSAHYSRQWAVRQGAADFLVKPVPLYELVLRIKQARQAGDKESGTPGQGAPR